MKKKNNIKNQKSKNINKFKKKVKDLIKIK